MFVYINFENFDNFRSRMFVYICNCYKLSLLLPCKSAPVLVTETSTKFFGACEHVPESLLHVIASPWSPRTRLGAPEPRQNVR